MTDTTPPALKAAQDAIAAGQTAEAFQLLKRYARENPNDYRPWLWLAGLAKTKQQCLAYLDRAERLNPGAPTIQKARLWAQERFAGEQERATTPAVAVAAAVPAIRSQAPPRPVTRSRRQSSQASTSQPESTNSRSWLALGTIFLLLALLIASAALLLSNRIFPGTALAAAPTATLAAPDVLIVAEVPTEEAAAPSDEQQSSGLPSPTPAATRGLPTPTLQPTNTPAPTPSPIPTVVVNTGGDNILETVTVGEGERWVDVNLTSQLLTAYEGGDPVYSTLISSGTSDHPTVTGQFRIWMRYEAQTMNGYLLGYDYYLEDVPYVMYFYNDYALHGAYWHNNFGTPMSHGCVNLSIADAEWIFNFTNLGTLVNVHY